MKDKLIIDCGTTNLRVTLVDEDNQVLGMQRALGGVRHTAIDGNNNRLRAMLKEAIDLTLANAGKTAQDIEDCIAYGMITSNMGLVEIPHLAAPAGRMELRAGMRTEMFADIAPFPIRFIPGVRNFAGPVDMMNFSAMDMMRGEETESVGLYDLMGAKGPAVFVLPGSHNKFVSMNESGRITGCMTSISGELLDAMTHHTIIADAVGRDFADAVSYVPEMAKEGAWECAQSGLGRAAFAGRILSTLGGKTKSEIQSYLLGAALAQDVQAMQTFVRGDMDAAIYVAGKPPVQQAMCDVIEALEAGDAQQVPLEISKKMGLHGALLIGG